MWCSVEWYDLYVCGMIGGCDGWMDGIILNESIRVAICVDNPSEAYSSVALEWNETISLNVSNYG